MHGSSRRARKGQASCPIPWLVDRSFCLSACASKTIRPPHGVNGANTHAGTIVGGDRTGCNTAHCLIQAYASVLDGSVPRQKARFFATIFVSNVSPLRLMRSGDIQVDPIHLCRERERRTHDGLDLRHRAYDAVHLGSGRCMRSSIRPPAAPLIVPPCMPPVPPGALGEGRQPCRHRHDETRSPEECLATPAKLLGGQPFQVHMVEYGFVLGLADDSVTLFHHSHLSSPIQRVARSQHGASPTASCSLNSSITYRITASPNRPSAEFGASWCTWTESQRIARLKDRHGTRRTGEMTHLTSGRVVELPAEPPPAQVVVATPAEINEPQEPATDARRTHTEQAEKLTR